MVSLLVVLAVWIVTPIRQTPDCAGGPAIGSIVDVKTVDGQPVQIRRAGRADWAKAEAGMEMCPGDQVRSRFRSEALVRVEDVRSGQAVEAVVGVNSRIRTMGSWYAMSAAPDDVPMLDIVHGVVKLTARGAPGGAYHYVRTGPSVCRFRGEHILANWDPFKREANYLVEDGEVSCVFRDSTVVVSKGKSLEVIDGKPERVKPATPLVLESFVRATRFD